MAMPDLRDEINRAVTLHAAWKQQLVAALEGQNGPDPEAIGQANRCELGCWLESLRGTRLGATPHLEEVVRLHDEFHRVAAAVARAVRAGDLATARYLMGTGSEFRLASARLVAKLVDWSEAVAKGTGP
jgi:hypothetical protein